MQKKRYTAITIGPIGDTLGMVTKPAALWAASYMFSFISRKICEEIVQRTGAPENIITPYFPLEKERTDGVGLFHDHIIVRDEDGVLLQSMPDIRKSVLQTAAEIFGFSDTQAQEYIMIRACSFETDEEKKENIILKCGPMLDCMELAGKFSSVETVNPILSSFTNQHIRDSVREKLGIDPKNWQLVCPNSDSETFRFRDIRGIAETAENSVWKKNNYYCLLRADGDNMTSIISSLQKTNENDYSCEKQCRAFSKVCLDYCSKVADRVGAYGGVTIYAGGDDLFALVPCEGIVEENTSTVFSLMKSVRELFDECFADYIGGIRAFNETLPEDKKSEKKDIPTLSFGALICHKKYPLYEAVAQSYDLLTQVAKNREGKNAAAVQLLKHSGQSESLVFSCTSLEGICELLDTIISAKSAEEASDREQVLLSAAQKILLFEALFENADKKFIKNLFVNTFDADAHQEGAKNFLHERLPDFFARYCVSGQICAHAAGKKQKSPTKAFTFGQLLRMMKFFVEKGDDADGSV